MQKIGQEKFEAFTKECLVERSKSIGDVIHRNKMKVFTNAASIKHISKEKQQMTSLKSDVGLFSRLYIGCQTRDGNLEDFFRHENQACPPALSDGNNLYLGTKSDLLKCLDLSEPQPEAPVTTSLVLDGAAIVQMLKPAATKNFDEYACQIFIPYILSQTLNVSRVDLVWDRYIHDSLKGTARAKRGKGVRRRVMAGATIPVNWQSFLRVDSNKTELFRFLSDALLKSFNQESDKQLIITDGESVLSKPLIDDVGSLSPCNHEEADSRMLLHVIHAAHHNHHKIMIRTVDTDVVVLAVYIAQSLGPGTELWLAFGTGKNLRHLAAHKIASTLGPRKQRHSQCSTH